MKIIHNNKIDMHALKASLAKPEIFTKSAAKFWDDQHISGQMLTFHLNPEIEAASKTSVCEGGGFWSPDSYIEILNTCLYENPKTEGIQYTIIDANGAVKIIRLYHRLFGLEEIAKLLNNHHFTVETVYRNLKGETLGAGSETYGIIARKA